MQQVINDFLDFVGRSRSGKTSKTYAFALRTFVEIVGEDAPLTKETYIKFLRRTTDMNPSTQAICRSAIKGLYLYVSDDDPSIQTNFFQQIDRRYALKSNNNLPVFNREGIEQMISFMSTIRSEVEYLRDRAFVLLLADTGLRSSEACGLRVGDIDWAEQRTFIKGKGNKPAVIHISNRATAALRDYLTARGSFSKAAPLFVRHDKKIGDQIKPVNSGGMWVAVKRRAVEAGVDKDTIRVHDFRHYFITTVYYAKGIRQAQKLGRHSKIETTGRYTHLIEDDGDVYNEIFNQ